VGRNVFVVEDIVDTGTTLKALMPKMLEKKRFLVYWFFCLFDYGFRRGIIVYTSTKRVAR